MMRIIRSAYSDPVPVRVYFPEVGRTKQSFKDECNVNNIVAKYQRTGVLEFNQKHEARYMDTTGIEFAQAMSVVARATEMFADLPSSMRKRFANDPVRFMDFVHDPSNLDEGVKLGIFDAPKPPPIDEPVSALSSPLPVALA